MDTKNKTIGGLALAVNELTMKGSSMNFQSLLLAVINFLCLIFGLGTNLNQGFTERFGWERFRSKLWQRLLGSEERAIMMIRRFVGPLK